MREFKVGDKVKMLGTCSGCLVGEVYTLGKRNESNNLGPMGQMYPNTYCNCQNLWELVEPVEGISNNKSIMTNIKTFVKNLTLSVDEKLLRKHNLKNDCGDYTQEAKDIVLAKLCEEKESYLIGIAVALEAEEK